mgnify:CR=1 FL=1
MTKLLEKTHSTTSKIPSLPESWYKAAGFAKNKKKALEKHLKEIRGDWDKR